MTLHQRQLELERLELDREGVAAVLSEINTPRLYLLAEAIRFELSERSEGKPADRRGYH